MPPGKMAAQAGHAFVEAIRAAESAGPSDDLTEYRSESPGTKVVLVAPDEYALLRAHEDAREHGIPSALVYDSGHVLPPHFDGRRILTAVGIGPCTKRKAAPATGRLALVP